MIKYLSISIDEIALSISSVICLCFIGDTFSTQWIMDRFIKELGESFGIQPFILKILVVHIEVLLSRLEHVSIFSPIQKSDRCFK